MEVAAEGHIQSSKGIATLAIVCCTKHGCQGVEELTSLTMLFKCSQIVLARSAAPVSPRGKLDQVPLALCVLVPKTFEFVRYYCD